MNTLVVAEKPSVARDIARALGAGKRGEGFLSGNGYVVTWALGHLVSLCEPDEIDPALKRWRDSDLPILPDVIPLKTLEHGKAQYTVIAKLMRAKDVGRIVCATDAGREGELIFRYIYNFAKCKKPVDRLWISSMTDEAIQEGFRSLKPSSAYDALYDSARCRAEADWLVGMNASRAYTVRYGALLSMGRVQTPTLALLVRRRREIDAFVPTPYWVVTADLGDYQGVYFDPADPKKPVETAEKANAIANAVRGKTARVQSVTKERKSEPPPQLYDLTTLQREANRALGLTAQQTLDAAQSLYEKHKLLTYPRTDSRYLPDDQYPKVPKALESLPEPLQAFARELLSKPLPKGKRVFDASKVSDHHAILPTGRRVDLGSLTQAERGVYMLVCKRLAAAFMPEHRYEQTRVVTECEGHLFRSSGRVVQQVGWKAVYNTDMPSVVGGTTPPPRRSPPPVEGNGGGSDEQTLPALKEGATRVVREATVREDKTKPPPQLTDATLLSAMEHAGQKIDDDTLREAMRSSGLGTPATRAAILERLIQVGYARRDGKTIVATDKGARLIDVAPPILTEPALTGKWEKALNDIAAGDGKGERFRLAARKLAASLVAQARESRAAVVFEKENRTSSGKRAPANTKRAAVKTNRAAITRPPASSQP